MSKGIDSFVTGHVWLMVNIRVMNGMIDFRICDSRESAGNAKWWHGPDGFTAIFKLPVQKITRSK